MEVMPTGGLKWTIVLIQEGNVSVRNFGNVKRFHRGISSGTSSYAGKTRSENEFVDLKEVDLESISFLNVSIAASARV